MLTTTQHTSSSRARQGTYGYQANNRSISLELYNQYRDMALTMINTNNPELNYIALDNSVIPGCDTYGLHEKFIHYGRAVIDLSVGEPYYPWVAADADPANEITSSRLQQLANTESNPLIAGRIRKIANFVAWMPSYTRIYFYTSGDGNVKSITIEDEMNLVKFNMIVSYEAI